MKHLYPLALIAFIFSCDAISIEDACITKSPGLRSTSYGGSTLPLNTAVVTVDGGSLDNSLAIADVLFANNIQGAFFIRGQDLGDDNSILETIVNQGHAIANGSYTGESLDDSRTPVLEVRQTDFLISPFVQNNAFLFAAPNGLFNQRLASYLNQAGLNKYTGPIGYDHSTVTDDCWLNGRSVSDCASDIFQELSANGKGILRISSSDKKSIEISQTLINLLSASGYTFLKLT